MLEKDLQNYIVGEVRFDPISRILYSTDASNYEIIPVGVVFPKSREDARRAVEIAHSYGVPILPRGAGTSLAGQTVGEALVLDFSRYMKGVLELNLQADWVRVEPGIVLDELNFVLAPHQVFWAVDTATSNRAVIGGQIGNNSCGARSVAYGKTLDQVLELEAILPGGEMVTLGMQRSTTPKNPKTGELHRKIDQIIAENRSEIDEKYPKILRRVGGYNLDEMARENAGLARLMVGSEGTLGVVTSAKLKLTSLPAHRPLLMVSFASLSEAMKSVPIILSHSPSAVELLDRVLLDLTRKSPSFRRFLYFLKGSPDAILIVEFSGNHLEDLKKRMGDLEKNLKSASLGYSWVQAFEKKIIQDIWKLRKAGLPLLQSGTTPLKAQTGVEDTAVSKELLGDYVERFQKILKKHNTYGSFYGHASVGCLHIRPFLNLQSAVGVFTLETLLEEVLELVLEFGGSMSGEHGDGLQRSHLNEKFFGKKLYQAFCQVKEVFDPQNLMNPGKIVKAPSPLANLRYGPHYGTRPLQTALDFSKEGEVHNGVELCNGSGVCRKRIDGVMCPSFMATGEEKHSTRGRANLLRAALKKGPPSLSFTSPEIYEALDLCLMCQGCKTECPASVDMAKLKEEFLFQYHKKHRRNFSDYFFGYLPFLSQMGSLFPGIANFSMDHPLAKKILSLMGLSSDIDLPPFAPVSFYQWWRKRGVAGPKSSKKVILFADTFLNYYSPGIGQAALEILEKLNYQVKVLPHSCCGRPLLSKGFIPQAKSLAKKNLKVFSSYLEKGWEIVGCEPSCIATLKDYTSLVPGKETELLESRTFLIQELLAREESLPFRSSSAKILYHGHCHEKASVTLDPAKEVLSRVPKLDCQFIESTCCGMAGSFGMEEKHRSLSLSIGELSLFPALKKNEDKQIIACGISCRQQIKRGTGREALHLVEFLKELME